MPPPVPSAAYIDGGFGVRAGAAISRDFVPLRVLRSETSAGDPMQKMMRCRSIFPIMLFTAFASGTFAGAQPVQQKQAISATVTGGDQHVGFRAMVMKQAIEYNLAGVAKNDANDIVHFTLQGDAERIDPAVTAVRHGTKKSSNITVNTAPAALDPGLSTFTIIDWTSTARNITTPYALVFTLRDEDNVISTAEAKEVWRGILKSTLEGEDLKKLGPDD